MYKISLPIMNSTIKRGDRARLLKELKRFDAERVFLALDKYETDEIKRREVMAELSDNCRFFAENGFEVGAWIWTFWLLNNTEFRNMRSIKGTEIKEFMCPTDENFVEFACGYIKDIAKCGVSIIQFDDDFRYGFLSDSPACLCDGHIARINAITGENSSREELEKHITSGGKNKFRDAYLKVNGDSFRNFASKVRSAVNEVDPQIRISLCACLSLWDIDGTDAYELSKILAGDTKPITRLIGAPYWAVGKQWGCSLQDAVELERMESAWTRKGDIEIMAEGDAYPRPRVACPASYLEGFDTAIRASGCTDGVFKYGIDYCSNPDYETGYAKFHERNRDLYKKIDEVFGDKTHVGVRVYEYEKKIPDLVVPTGVNETADIQNLFFSKSARTLAANTIPTVYEGRGVCGIAFDENARHLPPEAFENGLIIDIAAAEILSEKGIDTGIELIGEVIKGGDALNGMEEHFLDDGNYIIASNAVIYDIKLKDGAEVLSDIKTVRGTVPVSYRYENAEGQRFLVLNINTRSEGDTILKHYERSRQYATQVEWLGGKKLPAYSYGNPCMYMQCKENEGTLAVGLWNYFADIAMEPVVELGKSYEKIEFVNCTGRLEGDKVYLSDIPAFGFAAFEVK